MTRGPPCGRGMRTEFLANASVHRILCLALHEILDLAHVSRALCEPVLLALSPCARHLHDLTLFRAVEVERN